jgi:ferritin-like metal-binding protein YciE
METLHELLVHEIQDLYSAEKMLVRMLPRMAKKAQSPELKRAFEKHLRETEQQVTRLEQVAQQLGSSPRGKKCLGMEGLINEGKELLSEKAAPEVMDAGLIGAAQKVEHYEMATYGTARTHAAQLGHTRVADMLQKTLDEESTANETLTALAESMVNLQAMAPEGEAQGQARRNGRSTRKAASR